MANRKSQVCTHVTKTISTLLQWIFYFLLTVGSQESTHFLETRFCHVPLLSPVYRHSVCTDPKCRAERCGMLLRCLTTAGRIWSARSRVVTTAFRLKLPDNGRCGFGLTASSFVPMLMQTRFHSFSPDPCHRVVHPTPVFAHVRPRQPRNFISNNWTRARQVYRLLAAVLTPLH